MVAVSSETHGVPESLEFKQGEGGFENSVYECVVCNTRITGTENAKTHDSCPIPEPCPACGRRRGRPSLGTDYSRVDTCRSCGVVFRDHIDGGVT